MKSRKPDRRPRFLDLFSTPSIMDPEFITLGFGFFSLELLIEALEPVAGVGCLGQCPLRTLMLSFKGRGSKHGWGAGESKNGEVSLAPY